jgi:hypothetical protein
LKVFELVLHNVSLIETKNNETGGKMVWYPREMKRTNVSGVYPSSAGGGLGQDR